MPWSSTVMAAEQPSGVQHTVPGTKALTIGEKLTYMVSWSKLLDAGIAELEIKESIIAGGVRLYRFVGTARSVGIVETFFPIRISIESIMDARKLSSISFTSEETMGRKKRKKQLFFDQESHSVRYLLNEDPPQQFSFPGEVQDALSVLYFLRTRREFLADKPIVVNVFESEKTWPLEITTVGKERITTPAGEFNTIKIKTFPEYESVFSNKSEITMWITDDDRKMPVLVKSTIMIGSVVFTLTKIETGKDGHALVTKPQTTQ